MICERRTAARSTGGSAQLEACRATGSAGAGDEAVAADAEAATGSAGVAARCGIPARASSSNSNTGNERSSTLRRLLIPIRPQ